MKLKNWFIPALTVTVLADGYIALLNRSSQRLDVNPFRFILLLGLMSGVFFFHKSNALKILAYRRTLFIGDEIPSGRSYQYDYLRVFAVVSVICVHTLEDAASTLDSSTFPWYICTLLATLFLTCNLIYVMISGALLLGMKEETLFSFYWKRFLKTAVPLFAYYLIYAAVHGGIQNLYPANLPSLLAGILAGPPAGAPHFWLIYVILSLYLTVPFIRLMLFHMPDRMLKALIIIFLVFQATIYLPYFNLSFGVQLMLGAWQGVFILGYVLSRPAGIKWRKPMIGLGAISVCITAFCVFYFPEHKELYTNTVPTMTCMAAAIFSLVDLYKEKLKRPSFLIRTLSHYSYSLILIHWFVLYYIVKNGLHLYALGYPLILLIGLTALFTLLFSYLIAWIFDNTIVFLFQSILERLQRLWKGLL